MDIGRELRVIQVAKATSFDVAYEMDSQTEKTLESHEKSAACVDKSVNCEESIDIGETAAGFEQP